VTATLPLDTPVPLWTASGPRVIGLDLSLTGTGIAGDGWADTLSPPPRRAAHRDKKDKVRDQQLRTAYNHERIAWIRGALVDRYLHGVQLVVMEGLAFDAHDTDRQNAGLSWMVRHLLWGKGIPYALVPPATLKQFVTGTGAAGKDLMRELVADWFPWFAGDDNAADATGLMAMGHAHMGAPFSPVLDLQRVALSNVVWPEAAR
jgi:hypothetical protein